MRGGHIASRLICRGCDGNSEEMIWVDDLNCSTLESQSIYPRAVRGCSKRNKKKMRAKKKISGVSHGYERTGLGQGSFRASAFWPKSHPNFCDQQLLPGAPEYQPDLPFFQVLPLRIDADILLLPEKKVGLW